MRHLLPVLLLALLLPGCSRCSGDDPTPDSPRAGASGATAIPASPAAVTTGLATFAPADVEIFVALRDWERLMGIAPGLRARLPGEAGTIAQVETDLRNTFGVRLDDPDSLRDLGLAPNGGAAFLVIGETPVFIAYLADTGRFDERIPEILREQPFAMRGEPRQRTVDGASVTGWTMPDEERARVTTGRYQNIGFLIPLDTSDTVADATIRAIRQAEGDSLAERADFQAALPRTDGMAFFGWIGPGLVGEDAGLSEIAGEIGENTRVPFALHTRVDGLDLRILYPASSSRVERLRAIAEASAPRAELGRIPGPDAWGVVRLTLQPSALLAEARSEERAASELDQTLSEISTLFQLDVQSQLIPALGANMIVAFTRVRAMTLIRAINNDNIPPGDLLDALGAIVAIELTDREPLLEALQRIAAAAGEDINQFEDRGMPVFTVRDPRASLLSLVLHEHFLLLVPERQRGALLDRIAGDADSTPTLIRDDSATRMLTAPSANGAYLNLGSLLTGPLGNALNAQLPIDLSQVALFADQVYGRMRIEDEGLRIDASLRYAPVP